MSEHSKYSGYAVTLLSPLILLFLSEYRMVDGLEIDSRIYFSYAAFTFGSFIGLMPSLIRRKFIIKSSPSRLYETLLNLVLFVAIISAAGAVLHIANNGLSVNLRDELEFEGAGLLFPFHAEVRSLAIMVVTALTIGAGVFLQNKKYMIKCALCVLLFSVSLASRAVAAIIIFMPFALFLAGWLKVSLKMIAGFLILALALIFISSIIQARSELNPSFNLLFHSILQAFGYYTYPPYLFSEVLNENIRIDFGFAVFGSPIVYIYDLIGENYSNFVNEFFTKKFDLISYTGVYTPANVFHSWPSLLYVSSGLLACILGGIINGLVISFCRIFGGPISYSYALYFFAFGSYIAFPLQRMSTILGIFFCIALDKSITNRLSIRLGKI